MFSGVKTRSLNCPQILFHRLKGEALLFLWNAIFLMKAVYQESIFAVEKWQNWCRDNTDLEGNFEKILKNQIEVFWICNNIWIQRKDHEIV